MQKDNTYDNFTPRYKVKQPVDTYVYVYTSQTYVSVFPLLVSRLVVLCMLLFHGPLELG